MKIQIVDDCGSMNCIWDFPGTKAELLDCWEKYQIPCIDGHKYQGEIRPIKDISELEMECDAHILHHEHDADGNHIHLLYFGNKEMGTLYENVMQESKYNRRMSYEKRGF